MTRMTPHDRETHMELLFDRTLRDLPSQRAPFTLEARVNDELRRRAARPWWRRSFTQWPLLTRMAFLATCTGVATLTISQGAWLFLETRSGWTQFPRAFPLAIGALASSIADWIPATWMYVGLGVGAVLYAGLFGLGAAAYRALYLQPLNDR
jgi:hypothetical protein